MGGLNDLIDGEAETLDQRLEGRGGTESLMPTAAPPGREKICRLRERLEERDDVDDLLWSPSVLNL
jgi:hypothetical protein